MKSGQYRLMSYFLAKTAVSVPFESAIAIVFTVIIYNMIGFQACYLSFPTTHELLSNATRQCNIRSVSLMRLSTNTCS